MTVQHYWQRPKPWGRGSAFDALIADLQVTADDRARRRRGVAAKKAVASMAKAISEATAEMLATTPPKKPMTPLLVATPRPGCGAVLAKAHATLNSPDLSASARGTLLLALAKGVDPQRLRQAKREALASLKAVEVQLAHGATEVHLRSAANIVREATALMAAGPMSDADSMNLDLALRLLRGKIEGVCNVR
jgi:hypothetical protein